MPWLQIRIPTLPPHTDLIEDTLLLAGCQAVTLVDTEDRPVFEPIRGTTPLWEQTTIQGLFEHDIDADQLTQTVSQIITEHALTAGPIQTEILEDKDWEREWMTHFKPIPCGDKLWIVPSWLDAPNPKAVNLRLDPGLAFGTGTHPTTFLCLEWLNDRISGQETILDYGCGSGILGLAALLLGAKKMDGIDIDPQAITATTNNAITNNIDVNDFFVTTDASALKPRYDIVVANILAGPLCDLSNDICQYLNKGQSLILSGILEHQASTVIQAYAEKIEFEPITEKEGWVRLSGRRK